MRTVLWVVLLLVALGSLSSLLSPVFWGFDLVNHLRPQAMAVSVLVLVLAGFCGRWLTRAALGVVAVNAVLLAAPLFKASGVPRLDVSAPRDLRILAANVLTANRDHAKLLALIRAEAPDVVLLTETNRRWITALQSLDVQYPHRLVHPRQDNFGMAVFSKVPFDGSITSKPDTQVPLTALRFDGLTVFNAHPVPPVSAQYAAQNSVYLNDLAGQVAQTKGPVIVAGDLNTTLWGDAMGPMLDRGLKTLNPDIVAYTWPVHTPLLAMQIDHLLGRGITSSRFRVLGEIGSDHFPIVADVIFK